MMLPKKSEMEKKKRDLFQAIYAEVQKLDSAVKSLSCVKIRFIAVNSVNYRMAFSGLSDGFGFLNSDGSKQRKGYREFVSQSRISTYFSFFHSHFPSLFWNLLASTINNHFICFILTSATDILWYRRESFSSRVELNIVSITQRDCS